jgi:hypothetical protein
MDGLQVKGITTQGNQDGVIVTGEGEVAAFWTALETESWWFAIVFDVYMKFLFGDFFPRR